MKRCLLIALIVLSSLAVSPAATTKKTDEGSPFEASKFTGLALRGIGPAVTSGRVSDLAVHPGHADTWYVATASGGVWKTTNAGTTWSPIFDSEGSYSIGCVTIDPTDPLVVWVGTGENNSQRSVSYGDGVYKSTDGGNTWKNVGLKASEHVAKILVDPRDGDVVYAAAQGPLWSAGGDRGLYKTTDGGKVWKQVLAAGEYTGVTDLVMDPRNPDVLFAATYQRFRRVWTLIDGGPESAIWKSTDAGATWQKLENGLPKKVDLGRIGLALSPADPDVLYAIVEAADKEGGFFRSADGGGSFAKMSDEVSDSPQYYNEIFADPKDVDRVYSMDTWMKVTDDGGKTFRKVGEKAKHVDNHVIWIDPGNTEHLIAGCDGGLYESRDRGATWHFFSNLPVTQFYKAAVDTDTPFYHVYGGTQDNNTLGGPSRTITNQGIMNSDWYVTLGGDGFQTQVDPEDPNIVYSILQYGVLSRYDRASGENIDLQPQPGAGEPALRWNWDSPLIISPHSHTRLYYGANILFRSDDRGDTWRAVSPDLTRQIDRNKLKVMGRVWSVDAVAKNASTSFYGNIVTLSESPLEEGLIYAGTDDGLIQVTEDGGATWRKIDQFRGVPEMSYVSKVEASRHDAGTVYAAFDNHKMGDFKPYVLKSTDRGRTWSSITSNLPERGTVYALAEDHVNADLLFAGTEYGLFFTVDDGGRWTQLKGGMPVIAVRDIVLQRRENDLVAATFGRGFYILDDYSPLRRVTNEMLSSGATLFDPRDAVMYMQSSPLGLKDKSFQGDDFYVAPNPPFGAVFTYYLADEIRTLKKERQEKERKIAEKGGDVFYPSWDELRAEDREEPPTIILTVSDQDGGVVQRIEGPVTAGFHRVAWDLRYPPSNPTELKPPPDDNPFVDRPLGPLAAPGTYTVSMARRVRGEVTPIGEAQRFEAVPLNITTLPTRDREALEAMERKTARLQRAVLGSVRAAKEAQTRLDYIEKALLDTPEADAALSEQARRIEARLKDLVTTLSGDSTIARRNEPTPPSIVERVQGIVYGHWTSTSEPTQTQREAYRIAAQQFGELLPKLKELIETDLAGLERRADAAGAPWTPGRVPRWQPE